MKIEAGKYYKTRDGRRVQVHVNRPGEKDVSYPWYHDSGKGNVSGFHALNADGTSCIKENESDLIAEWQDEPSPIRTVTRREIVAGNYGRVVIGENGSILLPQRIYTAEELREAAHIFNQIAEVLQENGK